MYLEFILPALTLGISAGFAPGPMMMLSITETLNHGWKGGMKVALAPLITDSPIILTTVILLRQFGTNPIFTGIISLAGACFLIFLFYKTIFGNKEWKQDEQAESKSLSRAIVTNFLNPNPYLFWSTVGAGFLTRGTTSQVILFLIIFYTFLVSGKLILAAIIHHGGRKLGQKICGYILRGAGIGLLALAVLLTIRAIHSFQ